MIKKIMSFFATIISFVIGCFTFWRLGKKQGTLEEKRENDTRYIKDVNRALSIRNGSDIGELRNKYKISDE